MIDYIIAISVIAALLVIVIGGIKKSRSGEQSGCGCSCTSCPSATDCHKDN